MPLNIAEPGKVYKIWRVGGLEKEKHHLENLGFVPGKSVTVLSRFNGYFVVCVDETRVGLEKRLAQKMILVDESYSRMVKE